ncbi:MAG: hypothetical protein HY319_24725 [Armatimonadetes bacterium]|nr:hypothetical protein [Armatimonadota bacterium]
MFLFEQSGRERHGQEPTAPDLRCGQSAAPYADLDRALQTYYQVRQVDYPIGLDDSFRYATSAALLGDPARACDNLKQIAKNVGVYQRFSSGDTLEEQASSVGMPVEVYESVMSLQKSTLAVASLNGWNLLA